MIDTDKYEGHTEDIERWQMMARSLPAWANEKDEQLVRDAVYLLEELKQTRESLWWCYDNYRFDGHPMVDADWNFIGNLLGADMESEEE